MFLNPKWPVYKASVSAALGSGHTAMAMVWWFDSPQVPRLRVIGQPAGVAKPDVTVDRLPVKQIADVALGQAVEGLAVGLARSSEVGDLMPFTSFCFKSNREVVERRPLDAMTSGEEQRRRHKSHALPTLGGHIRAQIIVAREALAVPLAGAIDRPSRDVTSSTISPGTSR